jgi:hypothetical protein
MTRKQRQGFEEIRAYIDAQYSKGLLEDALKFNIPGGNLRIVFKTYRNILDKVVRPEVSRLATAHGLRVDVQDTTASVSVFRRVVIVVTGK